MKIAMTLVSMSFGGVALVAGCSSSSSSGNAPDSGAVVTTAPMPMDGGIPCGAGGACAAPDECCFADPRAPTCVSHGGCAGSSLGCSTAAQCASGQVCCFTYGSPGEGGAAAARPYTAECTEVCAGGDSTHYQLCV